MDRMRALEYFVTAAETGSFSSAARRLDVSMPAVLKLINALEKDLGAVLFSRGPRGLTLTAEGAVYLDRCRPLLEAFDEASASMRNAGGPRGLLVVGIAPYEEKCIGSHLARFHQRFPDIELDLRPMPRATARDSQAVDVFLMPAWQEDDGLVSRILGGTRYRVLAAPAYWEARGVPRHPRELAEHDCLVYRAAGQALDVWEFERRGEVCAQAVKGWLVTGCRDVLLQCALAGAGVFRARDVTTQSHAQVGQLVPVLTDWTARHAPPPAVHYRPRHRRTARVRVFVEFAAEVFAALEAGREMRSHAPDGDRPPWWGTPHARVSRWARRRD